VSPETSGDFITLARVVKTQGRHGEVAAEIHSDVPGRFAAGMKLFALSKESARQDAKPIANAEGARQSLAQGAGAERFSVEIEDIWPHKGLLVLKFVGVDSISEAEVLIGSELQVPRAERAVLDQGWTYVGDLIGCTVFDLSSGTSKEIGRIEDVQFGAGEAPLLIVRRSVEDGEVTKYDVPFAEAYLESVDVAKREVRMNLPEGMLEINAPMTAEEKQRFERARLKPRRKGSINKKHSARL
jgi:16S rRNA processing protein RimM